MNPLRGIALKVVSVFVFVAMSAIIKATSDTVPPGEAVFFRSAFAIPVIVVWLAATGGLRTGFATSNPIGHFWRGLLGVTAMGFGFAGLGLLPLPEVTAIGYAAPLLTVIFAAMFLGEQVRLFRIAAVALGMAGVLIVLSPRLSMLEGQGIGATEALGAVVVLTGAVFASLAQVFVRKLVGDETTSSIVFWFSVNASVLSLVTLPFGWVLPDAGTFALLVLTGIMGGVGQILLTSAYRHADTSVVAPFEYVSMLLAVLVGFSFFGEVPTLTVLVGTGLIVAAGIIIILRERQLGIERAKQRRSMSP
ncbi:MAG: hypothetical protein RLZZ528_2090 [Pseudomonadota bacterium]